MSNNLLKFPADFLWGVSTSAYQIEGNITNDWSEWEKSEARQNQLRKLGQNPDDFISGQACDSYNRYEEDLDLVKNLNCGAFRLGIEWARIEPEPGVYNMKEVLHYRDVLLAMKKRNIKAVVTLWHWTNPLWLARQGGWENKNAVKHFCGYVRLIVKELGGLVDFWVTVNEPMVFLSKSYLVGKFPPEKKYKIFKARIVFNNLIAAQRQAYEIIHGALPDAQVGLTMLENYFEPARGWCLVETGLAKIADYFWNKKFLNKLNNQFDFIGIDYYFHDRLVWRPWFLKNLNKQVTDMGWEIYPEGIYHVIKNLAEYKKPLYIMENGLADATDAKRGKFITDHLKYVHQAMAQGALVRGYFYWSLLDNFEWNSGWAPKFGLYAMDRKTFKRAARPSAKVYGEICKNNFIKK